MKTKTITFTDDELDFIYETLGDYRQVLDDSDIADVKEIDLIMSILDKIGLE